MGGSPLPFWGSPKTSASMILGKRVSLNPREIPVGKMDAQPLNKLKTTKKPKLPRTIRWFRTAMKPQRVGDFDYLLAC